MGKGGSLSGNRSKLAECQSGGIVAMNIGEMQRLLSLKAEREPNHRFGDLYSLICREDWLRLACAYAARDARYGRQGLAAARAGAPEGPTSPEQIQETAGPQS